MDNKNLSNYFKDEIGALITVIMVSIMLLSKNFLAAIPFIIVISFVMYYIGVRPWTIYISATLTHIILGTVIDRWVNTLMFPTTILQITGGYFLAKYLKRLIHDRKQPKHIFMFVLSLVIISAGIGSHGESFSNPIEYSKAKKNIQKYIDDTYDGNLIIDKITYSSKMNDYFAYVYRTKNPRDTEIIVYNSGHIGDGYHSQIEEDQGRQAMQILVGMIKQRTDIPVADIDLHASVNLPHNKYIPRDMYLGEEPIFVDIKLIPNSVEDRYEYKEKYGKFPERHSYEDIEAFCKEVYKILGVLKEINYPYKGIKIESYLPDGNRAYTIEIADGVIINSMSDLLESAYIEDDNKE